jgi:superoxide dismutase, Cu-Zn family
LIRTIGCRSTAVIKLAYALALPLALSAPAFANDTASAPLVARDRTEIGTVTVDDGPHGSIVRIAVLPGKIAPGWHGIHFHAAGDCSDVKFDAAKAHVNHGGKPHGFLNPKGPDRGDLPNVFAAQDGSIQAEVFTSNRLNGQRGLRDRDGSALILHEKPDDHQSQPVGNAGDRIACAQIR